MSKTKRTQKQRYLVLLLCLYLMGSHATAQTRMDDSLSLVELYNTTDGPNWTITWDLNQPMDDWFGVFLTNGRVTCLDLDGNEDCSSPVASNNNLVGDLPNLNLTELQTLTLTSYQLSGNIPDFSNLPNLQFLRLFSSQLSGNIPDFSNLPNLQELSLGNNQLSGSIPDFSNLPNLQILRLGNNQLSGNIPDFSNLPNLQELSLVRNQLSGNMPDFTNLPNLINLAVPNNQLNGNMPDFSDNCPNLVYLQYFENRYTFDGIISTIAQNETLVIVHHYAPQDSIGTEQTTFINQGDNYTIDLIVDDTVTTSTYQWYKDGTAYTTTTTNELNFTNLQPSDAGTYTCEVTNPYAPELTLYTYPHTLVVNPSSFSINCSQALPATNSDGEANINLSGGLAPYEITWIGPSSGNITGANDGDNLIGSLSIGTYTFTVTDADGFNETCEVTISSICNANMGTINFTNGNNASNYIAALPSILISDEVFASDVNANDAADALNDNWESAISNNCSGLFSLTYGTINAPVDGIGGTISDLFLPDGSAYGGTVTYELVNVSDPANPATYMTNTGSQGSINGIDIGFVIPLNNSLQDDAPAPTSLNGTFYWTESLGGTASRNGVRFCFSDPLENFGAFFGDLETGNLPAEVVLLDAGDGIITAMSIPTITADPADCGNCGTGGAASNNNNFEGCGNKGTRWIGFEGYTTTPVSCMVVIVGDDDAFTGCAPDCVTGCVPDDGNSEHLSFGGASAGGFCVICTDLCEGAPLIHTTTGSTDETNPDYSKIYILADNAGTIITTSNDGDFTSSIANVTVCTEYRVHTLVYNSANPPTEITSLIVGNNINIINDGCFNPDFQTNYGCYNVCPAPEVVITPITTPNCATGADGSVEITINNGVPPYNVINTGTGIITPFSVNTNGGTTTITGLTDGNMYSFDIEDVNLCIESFAGQTFECVSLASGCQNTNDVFIPESEIVTSGIVNSGSAGIIGTGTEILSVCVLIEHPFIGDLILTLIAPDGNNILLSANNGTDFNYGDVTLGTEVCFTPTATNDITAYAGGQTGDWLPEEPTGFTSLGGVIPNGTWLLQVFDNAALDTGTLLSWSIEFDNGDCSTSIACDVTLDVGSVTCPGDSDGTLFIEILNPGTGPWTTTWTDGAGASLGPDIEVLLPTVINTPTYLITGLPEGQYVLTIMGGNCSGGLFGDSTPVTTISANTPLLETFIDPAITTPVTCNGGTDGVAETSPVGGVGSYSYLWDNNETSNVATALNAGIHTVTVTDTNGCTATNSVTITEPAPLSAIISSTPESCSGNDGTASVSATGESGTYTYQWDAATGSQTTPTATNLTAGTYFVTVTDAACGSIAEPVVVDSACNCNIIDATINVSPCNDNGTPNDPTDDYFNFTIEDIIQGDPTFSNGFTFDGTIVSPTDLSANETAGYGAGVQYTSPDIIIEDAQGGTVTLTLADLVESTCILLADLTIPATCPCVDSTPPSINCPAGVTQPTDPGECFAMPDTWLPIPGFTDDCGPISISNNQPSVFNLGTTFITYVVTDAVGNETTCSYPITIIDDEAPILDCSALGLILPADPATCSYIAVGSDFDPIASDNCNATLVNDLNSTATLDNEAFPIGTTTVVWTLTDDAGNAVSCSVDYEIQDSEPPVITNCPGTTIEIASLPDCEANVAVMPLLATDCQSFTITNDYNNTSDASDIYPEGTTTVIWTVTDASGNNATCSTDIVVESGLFASATSVDESCAGNDGSIDLTVTGGTPPYIYNWTNGQIVEDILNLSAGTYSVLVVDANDCETGVSILVNSTCDCPSGNFVNDPSGFAPICTENLTNELTDWQTVVALTNPLDAAQDPLGTGSIVYSTTLDDASGTWTPDGDLSGINGNHSGADICLIEEQIIYAYLACNGNTPGNTTDDTYELVGEFILQIWPFPDVTSNVTGCTGEVINSCPDGIPEYSTDGGATFAQTPPSLNPGDPDLIVNWQVALPGAPEGCAATGSYTLSCPCFLVWETPVIDFTPLCNGDCTGEATVFATGGTAPYNYQWDNGDMNQSANNLCAGTYEVTITDDTGCIVTGEVIINEPDFPFLNLDVVNETCAGNDGSIDLTVTGGTPPYNYIWNTGATTQDLTDLSEGTYAVTVGDINGCTLSSNATVVSDCNCNADAGTITTSTGSNTISLCVGESFSLISNNDYTLPPPQTGEVSELVYALYNCPPPASLDPLLPDPCFSGWFWAEEDFLSGDDGAINEGGIPDAFTTLGITGTNNTIWWLPITIDDGNGSIAMPNDPDGIVDIDQNNDGCYATGTPIEVTYHPDITVDFVSTCDPVSEMGNYTITISGGLGPDYTINNIGDGTISGSLITVDGGSFNIDVLNGDVIEFTVTDGGGCTYGPYAEIFVCQSNPCLVDAELTANPPLSDFPNGEYPPNTTVEFCININEYTQTSFNFLHGIVPSFGGSWTGTITPTANPMVAGNNEIGSQWAWFPGNTITYNTTGNFITDEGWWFQSTSSPAYTGGNIGALDPNDSWGDGCTRPCYQTTQAICDSTPNGVWNVDCGGCAGDPVLSVGPVGAGADIEDNAMGQTLCESQSGVWDAANGYCVFQGICEMGVGLTWEACFTLTTLDETACATNQSLDVSVMVYGDGETGAWGFGGCVLDAPVEWTGEMSTGSGNAPVIDQPANPNICFGELVTSTAVSANALPTLEYVVTDPNTPATDGWGDLILGSAPMGTFDPVVDFGLSAGDPFCVTAVQYDLEQIQSITDSILMGSISPSLTCCDLAAQNIPAFCTILQGIGINSGSDIEDLNDVHMVLQLFSPGTSFSIQGIIYQIDTINMNLALLPDTCGGGLLPICYTADVAEQACYTVAPLPVAGTNTTSESCAGNDGNASVLPSGGTPPYLYLWDAATGNQTTQTAIDLTAGIYTATITDDNGCTATIDVEIEEIDPLITNPSPDTDICETETTTISVNPTGGSGSYIYNWDNGLAPNASHNVSPSATTTYNVTVTDANVAECSDLASITITVIPEVIPVFNSIPNTLCENIAFPSLPTTSDNGITGTWSPSTISQGIATYTFIPDNTNSCVSQTTIDITTVSPPDITDIQIDTASCPMGNDGSLTISATPGSGGGQLMYSIDGSNFGSSSVFSNLAAGVYSVFVTDQSGCTTTSEATIAEDTIALVLAVIEPSCGEANGKITIGASGGVSPYTYMWSDAQNGATAVGLSPGTYSVTVTDSNGCTATDAVTLNGIDAPTVDIDTVTDVLCFAETTGSIDVSVVGGAEPYTYTWNNGATTEDVSSLPAGTYSLTVMDIDSCIVIISTDITEPSALNLGTPTISEPTCNNTNGTISTTASGGISPYTYSLNAGTGQTDGQFTGLSAGTYSIEVTDANGCTESIEVILNDNVNVPIATIIQVIDVDCFGNSTGSINIDVNGGTPPYDFDWDNNAITEDLVNIPAGTYTVTITDSNGCTTTLSESVNQPTAPLVTTGINGSVVCNGDTNGESSVTANGGTPPYTYLWDDGQSTETATGLIAGTYLVTVTDANNCTATSSATITEPPVLNINTPVVTNAVCNDANGSITVSPTGGIPPYTYSLDGGTAQASNIFNGLEAGTYTITVIDDNACTDNASVIVGTTGIPVLTVENITHVACYGEATGSVELAVTDGVPPYSFEWSDGGTGDSRSDLEAGIYEVTVTDIPGCQATVSIEILEPDELEIYCPEEPGDSIITIIGGTPDYFIEFSSLLFNDTIPGTSGDNNISFLPYGTYYVTVTDANNCQATCEFILESDCGLPVVPDIITPNGDNDHPDLYILNINPDCPVSISIYNRWGERVFEKENYNNDPPWDGTHKGEKLPPTVYYYILERDGIILKRGGLTIF